MANHNQVAHAWANQTGKHRKGFNMYYDGPVIYSYGQHFPIARITDKGVLFTTRSYSISTAKHKTYVLRAINGTPWHVDNVMADTLTDHQENYRAMIARAREQVEKAKRAVAHGRLHLASATAELNQAQAYADKFGIPHELPSHDTTGLGLTDAEYQRIVTKANAHDEKRRARAAERERKRNLAARDGVRKWLKHESNHCPHTPRPYVRVSADRTMIETSWGASVPFADGLRLWAAMKYARRTGNTYHMRELAEHDRMGDFTVERVTPAYAKVGCHVIPYRFACLAAKVAGIE